MERFKKLEQNLVFRINVHAPRHFSGWNSKLEKTKRKANQNKSHSYGAKLWKHIESVSLNIY